MSASTRSPGYKIISGLKEAARHARDKHAQEASGLFKELLPKLVENQSFSGAKISKIGDKWQVVIDYSSGMRETIYG